MDSNQAAAAQLGLASAVLPGIHSRIRAVMADVKNVAKDRYQKFDKFYFTGHDDVTDPLHDAFVKHGIVQTVSLLECTRRDNQSVSVRIQVCWSNVDNPSDCITVLSFGEAMPTRDKGAKGDDLQIGKAVSYAVKYALLKNFMLVGGGIPDNEDEQPAPGTRTVERDPAPPAAQPAAEEQIMTFLTEYSQVKTKKDLDAVRDAIMPLVNKRRLNEEQESRLAQADSEAEARCVQP